MRYIQELKNCILDFMKLRDVIPNSKAADPAILGKVSKGLEKKVLEMFELIRKHRSHVIPMELLGQLTALQDFGQFSVNGTLKAKFLTLIVREYRKFKEVANVRQHKKQAHRMLEKLRLHKQMKDDANWVKEE